MEVLQKFIKIGDDRINAAEIVSYGLAEDEDEERYLYVETKTSDGTFQYYEDDSDFDLDEKVAEMDDLLLIRKLGRVDFEQR